MARARACRPTPRAWLVSAGRFRAIDKIRRRARFDAIAKELAIAEEAEMAPEAEYIADDQLRLIFVCCHPELPADAQVALTLREACGLTTEEIAAAFLTKPGDHRAAHRAGTARIRELQLPYEVPGPGELEPRLDLVLKTIYLIFNEGYAASHGDAAIRAELCAEAIRLARLVRGLLRQFEPEVEGLLALLLLQHARFRARADAAGDIVLMPDQDRSLWDRTEITEGVRIVEHAMSRPPLTAYVLEAAIAATHAVAPTADATDWDEIVQLDLLLQAAPSAVIRLNRAVAVAMRDGPQAGLTQIDALLDAGALIGFRYAHAVRADLLRRLGRVSEAREAYVAALELTQQAAERRFIEKRLREVVN
ncbi:MAG: hypothetical protein NVV63_11725 [Opitutus sp.]|nr:hypothetical protein [Opitutus sp.]